MSIVGPNMHILGANMYIVGVNMYILGANMYHKSVPFEKVQPQWQLLYLFFLRVWLGLFNGIT